MVRVLDIDAASPPPEAIKDIAATILAGGIVIIPTDTLYGIAVNSLDQKAVQKIYQIKKRDLNKPILLLIHNQEQLASLVKTIPEAAEKLICTFWPGPLTLIFEASEKSLPILRGNTSKIALRQPKNIFLEQLLRETGLPITGTSANISGYPPPNSIEEIKAMLGDTIDLIVYAGPSNTDKGSSIVDVTSQPPRLVREGTISYEELVKVWSKV
jgi:L-threonylcarbamoyladenylate synthase